MSNMEKTSLVFGAFAKEAAKADEIAKKLGLTSSFTLTGKPLPGLGQMATFSAEGSTDSIAQLENELREAHILTPTNAVA